MSVPTVTDWTPTRSPYATSWGALLVLETVLLLGYFSLTPAAPGSEIRYLVYPFVWINVAVYGVRRVGPHPRSRLHLGVAAVLAIAYFLVVMAIPGNIGFGTPGIEPSVRIGWYAPGWGPLVAVASPWLRLYLVPFEVIGYLGLTYLVFANLLALTRGTVSGLLGLATCIGCTVPILAPVAGILGGPATGLTATAYQWSYDLGTVIFVLSIGVLVASHPSTRGLRGSPGPDRREEENPKEQ